MTNWLERAKLEIPKMAAQVTAVAAERNTTAVMAVPQRDNSDNSQASIGSNGSALAEEPMPASEEALIRAWLAHIKESDPAMIACVLDQCRRDSEARTYFMRHAVEMLRQTASEDSKRRGQRKTRTETYKGR